MSKIHAREGFCFERTADGSVRVQKVLYGKSPSPVDPNAQSVEVVLSEATIPANEWASVVAHVSRAGESGETFQAALHFHGDERVG